MSSALGLLPASATVAGAMLHAPKTCDPATTVGTARDLLHDSHVHALLVVDGPRLLAVVERDDLRGVAPSRPVSSCGCLVGRVVHADDDLSAVAARMAADRRRRMAVVDDEQRLLGLLCRKRSGRGFCTDAGVAARPQPALA